jgi:hypothetical protein
MDPVRAVRQRADPGEDLDVTLVYAQYPPVVRINDQSGELYDRTTPDHPR